MSEAEAAADAAWQNLKRDIFDVGYTAIYVDSLRRCQAVKDAIKESLGGAK